MSPAGPRCARRPAPRAPPPAAPPQSQVSGSSSGTRRKSGPKRQLFGAAACSLALLSEDDSELVYIPLEPGGHLTVTFRPNSEVSAAFPNDAGVVAVAVTASPAGSCPASSVTVQLPSAAAVVVASSAAPSP